MSILSYDVNGSCLYETEEIYVRVYFLYDIDYLTEKIENKEFHHSETPLFSIRAQFI